MFAFLEDSSGDHGQMDYEAEIRGKETMAWQLKACYQFRLPSLFLVHISGFTQIKLFFIFLGMVLLLVLYSPVHFDGYMRNASVK